MRIRLPLGRALFFICAFFFCLLALLPLRLAVDWMALDQKGLAAREGQGSIWLGSLREAQFGSVPIGDLQAQMRSLPLLMGEARVDLYRREGAEPLEGSVAIARHGVGLNDIKARLDVASLFAPLPVSALDLDDLSVRYEDGLCAGADGQMKANLSGEVGGLALPGGLSGKARCERGALLLPLASQSGMEMLNIRLFQDGRYEIEFGVRPANPALAQKLAASGFAAKAGGIYVVQKQGKF